MNGLYGATKGTLKQPRRQRFHGLPILGYMELLVHTSGTKRDTGKLDQMSGTKRNGNGLVQRHTATAHTESLSEKITAKRL